MLSAICAVAMTKVSDDFKTWGLQAAEKIRSEYRLPNGLYADSIDAGKQSGPAFNWGVGVWLTALNAAAKADPAWEKDLRAYVQGTRVYWNDKGPVPGYDVLPGPKDVDRYYDDNMWMVMALCDASDILKDKQVLDWAEDTLKYVLSGEDDKLGGGIYWHEPKKESKNTCSNGPAAAACLAIYEKTKNPSYLESAKRLYAWTKKNLQDPADGLFWDNIHLNGKVEKTKWSYNTALMIRTAAELGRITGEKRYHDEAETMAQASEKRWVDAETGAIKDGGRFAHLLLDSWAFVPTPAREETARKALRWVYANARTQDGLFGPQFNRTPEAGKTKFELIDQASAARAFLMAPPSKASLVRLASMRR
ncbi:MAG: glycoside hydrolase family 76 protein [Fimbriimonas sp.]